MIKLPIGIAEKLQQMLDGQFVAASSLKHAVVQKMVEDGTLHVLQIGGHQRKYRIGNADNFKHNLKVDFGINDLQAFIDAHKTEDLTRSQAIEASSDSKLRKVRTFQGFLVNSYDPVACTLAGESFTVQPHFGSYTFVQDHGHFEVPANVTVIGIENPENFQYIRSQAYLFAGLKPLFVCRYPHSSDLVAWLKRMPNPYLHFGDFDFEGINIFLNEYQRHLGNKARFFIPTNIGDKLKRNGNRHLYDNQLHHLPKLGPTEIDLQNLVDLMHKYKKGLEQEVFIKFD